MDGSEWESSGFTGDPHSGEGYEAAFAYALASSAGVHRGPGRVDRHPVQQVVRAGAEGLRLRDAAGLEATEKRAEAVDFSEGYFDVNQALIANEGSPAIGVDDARRA